MNLQQDGVCSHGEPKLYSPDSRKHRATVVETQGPSALSSEAREPQNSMGTVKLGPPGTLVVLLSRYPDLLGEHSLIFGTHCSQGVDWETLPAVTAHITAAPLEPIP